MQQNFARFKALHVSLLRNGRPTVIKSDVRSSGHRFLACAVLARTNTVVRTLPIPKTLWDVNIQRGVTFFKRLLADLLPHPVLQCHRYPAHRTASPRGPIDLSAARTGGGAPTMEA